MILRKHIFISMLVSIIVSGCVRPSKPFNEVLISASTNNPPTQIHLPTQTTILPTLVVRSTEEKIETPTPDTIHVLPTPRTEEEVYVVQPGDALGKIALKYGVTLKMLIESNGIKNPDLLEIGQSLLIPVSEPGPPGSGFKIIPDSELVYGPRSADFDVISFVKSKNGYLAAYREAVDGERMGGAAIVQRIAQDYSVNPRLLLAVIEYQCGWLTQGNPDKESVDYPIGVRDVWLKGLYQQLAWTANALNRGYYLWLVNGVGMWILSDGSVVNIDPTINAGTAGVQSLFAALYDRGSWDAAVSESGLYQTFFEQFGFPFDYAVDPVLPENLTQPTMQLPFEPGLLWAFTGGPHGGWGSGSAWAALDFAPPGEPLGCVESEDWVVAVADGWIVRSGYGVVVQDLDGDSIEQTGWSVLYMHIETDERVEEGVFLKAGERIGHPSCEGGYSTGTHVHLARRYNGEWIPADQQVPFILDGWTSQGAGIEYNGYLVRDDKTIEAWEGYFPANQIQR